MKTLLVVCAFLLASAALAQSKPQSVVVTNPSLTIQAADAGRYTNVGQKPSRIVNLRTTNQFAHRIDPATGQDLNQLFEVPEGFVIVLTDIAASGVCIAGTTALAAVNQWVDGVSRIRAVIYATCTATGDYFVERHYTTGIVFGAGSVISVTPISSAEIEGYLVPAG